jgi:hypothetical protein
MDWQNPKNIQWILQCARWNGSIVGCEKTMTNPQHDAVQFDFLMALGGGGLEHPSQTCDTA